MDDAFLEQLVEALAELFELRRVRVVQEREGLRREAGDLAVENRRVRRERVTNAEAVVPDVNVGARLVTASVTAWVLKAPDGSLALTVKL